MTEALISHNLLLKTQMYYGDWKNHMQFRQRQSEQLDEAIYLKPGNYREGPLSSWAHFGERLAETALRNELIRSRADNFGRTNCEIEREDNESEPDRG